MKTSIIATILVSMTAAAIIAYPNLSSSDTVKPDIKPVINTTNNNSAIQPISTIVANEKQQKIEVAFVLDTTSSMSGLIQGAKDNIWSIASSMASAESAPVIKMGLVAFRDRGDSYVTKVVDLSEDLDTNYGTLMGFKANGGGDSPESVNKGLYDAVNSLSWSKDEDTYRVIFLVGDAPPQTHYQDEMQFPEIVRLANDKGIIINTVLCGNNIDALNSWKQIAKLSQGDFFQVEQSGSALAISTPYDKKIASLSKQLDDTRLFFGNNKLKESKRKKTAATDYFNQHASDISIARKAEFNSTKSGVHNFSDENELVGSVSSGRVELDSIAIDELPEELQSMDKRQQQKVIAERAQKRQSLQGQIAELGKKRSLHLKQELAKTDLEETSIDNKIYQSVKTQAGKKGLVYSSEAPKY